jgi:hypothetical protein
MNERKRVREDIVGATSGNPYDWDWPVAASLEQHHDRVALLRPIPFETGVSLDQESQELVVGRQGKALSINISSGGMLVVMANPPDVRQVLRIEVPTPVNMAKTPTLAEVRWTRKLPIDSLDGIYFVGLKFVL